MRCKTYCFAFQKHRFCTVKAALLQRKTYAFAMPNRNYRFSLELFLQNQSDFAYIHLNILEILGILEILFEKTSPTNEFYGFDSQIVIILIIL